jgi:Ca2+-binding EF-hand superfamily protein
MENCDVSPFFNSLSNRLRITNEFQNWSVTYDYTLSYQKSSQYLDLEEMIEEADINGDGKVDQSEFIRIMLQTNLFWMDSVI